MKTLTAALATLTLTTAPLAAFASAPHAGHDASIHAPAAPTAPAHTPVGSAQVQATAAAYQTIELTVVGGKYQAKDFEVKEGVPVRMTFVRKEYTPCTKEIVFPSLGITKELPVNEPVTIELPAQKAGEVEFHCGMKMTKGRLVVTPATKITPAAEQG